MCLFVLLGANKLVCQCSYTAAKGPWNWQTNITHLSVDYKGSHPMHSRRQQHPERWATPPYAFTLPSKAVGKCCKQGLTWEGVLILKGIPIQKSDSAQTLLYTVVSHVLPPKNRRATITISVKPTEQRYDPPASDSQELHTGSVGWHGRS